MNIHVQPQPLGQPTPGAAKPGNLYADLESRSLWLGVAPAVDESGSVLISDMLGLMDDIAAAEARANAYTDAQILTRAPLVHTHTASQITDFSGAVTTVVNGMPGLQFTTGMVMLYSGLLTSIGVGNLAGWALCDGGNGTPDLRDRFIVGAGGAKAQKAKNAMDAIATTQEIPGQPTGHVHTVNGTTLTLAQIPAHSHLSGTLAGKTSGNVVAGGSHNHFITCCSVTGAGAYRPMLQMSGNAVNAYTETEAAHAHATALVVDVNAGATANSGGSTSHNHSLVTAGSHNHQVTSLQLREAIPYFALAYIMKL